MGRRSLSHRRRRIVVLSFVGALAVVLAVASPASADFFWPDGGGSPNADHIQSLYKIVGVVALVVFLGVEGALFYALFKFKARRGAVAAQIRGNTTLEVGWTVGAAVILVVLAVFTFIKLGSIRNPPDSTVATGTLVADSTARLPPDGKSLNVCVNGQQYVWRFTYESGCSSKTEPNFKSPFTYEQLVVPQGVTVTLDIVAQDVAHSWWVPKLGGKFDAIPGYTNHTWFRIPVKDDGSARYFQGQCAELCGRNHADMVAEVKAIPLPQWKAWYAQQKKGIAAADAAAQKQREALAKQQAAGKNTAAAGVVTTTPTKTTTTPAKTTPTKTTPAGGGNAAADALGKATFTGAGGCSGCHTLADAATSGQVGPNLDKTLPGKSTAFILDSIIDPNKFIEKGYAANIMPGGFKQSLSPAQLKALVTYLHDVAGK